MLDWVCSWNFICGFFSIVLIDLILAGDNAVVIAMAVKSLPDRQRRIGIICGAGAAALLRVACTFFVAQLLQINYVKLIGGVLIAWIAVKLFREGTEECSKEAKGLWHAIWIIVVADITMSFDNMLAVAGASGGSLFLLIFGLGLSIPLVVFTSTLLSKLMDKYPIIIYFGAGVLGKVAGEMIITDPYVAGIIASSTLAEYATWVKYSTEVLFVIGVLLIGGILSKKFCKKK